MGNAELDIRPLLDVFEMKLEGIPDDTIISTIKPSSQNYLVEESHIRWQGEKVVQNVILRLRNVECGEIELQLTWIKNLSTRSH